MEELSVVITALQDAFSLQYSAVLSIRDKFAGSRRGWFYVTNLWGDGFHTGLDYENLIDLLPSEVADFLTTVEAPDYVPTAGTVFDELRVFFECQREVMEAILAAEKVLSFEAGELRRVDDLQEQALSHPIAERRLLGLDLQALKEERAEILHMMHHHAC